MAMNFCPSHLLGGWRLAPDNQLLPFACLGLDHHHQDIRMRDINTTPPQTSREGRAQTNKNHHCHKRTFRPSRPSLFIPKRRASPRSRFRAIPPALRSLFVQRPVRWVGIVGRNQPSDLSPTFPPLPMIHSLISAPLYPIHLSADLGIPKCPIRPDKSPPASSPENKNRPDETPPTRRDGKWGTNKDQQQLAQQTDSR